MSLSELDPRTWSRFNAGRFGAGLVVAHGGMVSRVRLPSPEYAGSLDAAWDAVRKDFSPLAQAPEPSGYALEAATRLEDFFKSGRNVADLRYVVPDSGPFWRRVWELCAQIPRGRTVTYGDLARMAGSPRATQSVGNAMAKNQLPLLIPCHRVVNTESRVIRYGGGAEMKLHLLELERAG